VNINAYQRNTVVDFILDLFARRGAEAYMGEPISMAQHMEQSAACAVADSASDDLVIAALLHDIGHFVGDFPIEALENGIDNLHQEAGATFLEAYYPASVTEPIRLHVAAKKYLCAVDEQYYARLSEASVQSLKVQGGAMTEAEIKTFESNPHHLNAIQLRQYDDDGKVAGLDIKPVGNYRGKLESLLQN
jgi:predicted HD phosphohydrolase